jgi:bifunctional UDP-N-acetylglucosamine pyrophosphorylase/glucosamine-1-phosphate N-acetyltransferase
MPKMVCGRLVQMNGNNRPALAVLLAAGRGKRLRPYTDNTPKPLLPVDGRPLLDRTLEAVSAAGIKQICLVTHHLAEQIEQFVGDGSNWGLTALFCRQSQLLGTAHALNEAVHAHPHWFQNGVSFLLTATDYIWPENYLCDLVAAHRRDGADISVSLKRMPGADLSKRSSVAFTPQGGIAQIVEKPGPGQAPSEFVASLTTILPATASAYLANMQPSPRGEYELQAIINQMIDDGYRAQGLEQPAPGEWQPHMWNGQ